VKRHNSCGDGRIRPSSDGEAERHRADSFSPGSDLPHTLPAIPGRRPAYNNDGAIQSAEGSPAHRT
jgi:hypothetical protein